MYTYYRMNGSRKLLALYRCEHCHRVAMDAVTLKKQTTYNQTWTRSGLERRRSRKEEELRERMDRQAGTLAQGVSPLAFVGKEMEGKCPHCGKKQSWMRMSYKLWGGFVGIMAMMTGFGVFSQMTFEGSRRALRNVQTATFVASAVMIALALGLIIHAATMYVKARRAMKADPVIIARTAEELLAGAAKHPAYMDELTKKA